MTDQEGEGLPEKQWTVSLLWSGRPFCYQLPGKSPSLSIDQRLLTGGVSLEKSSSATLPDRLQWSNKFHNCQSLLDSGAEGNFINPSFAFQLDIPVVKLPHPISVQVLGGQIIPSVTISTGVIKLITSANHTEEISLLLIDSPLVPVVLGHLWVSRHNPHINWEQNTVCSWSDFCHESCLLSACSSVSCAVLQEKPLDLLNVI